MYSCFSETSLKTLEDCSHLLQLPVRQHVRVVGHVGAHPHLDQQSPNTHPLVPVSFYLQIINMTDSSIPPQSVWVCLPDPASPRTRSLTLLITRHHEKPNCAMR